MRPWTRQLVARLVAASTAILAVGMPLLTLAARPAAALPPALATNWTITGSARNHSSSPEIADVNGDGVPEIVYGDLDGWVHVRRADGSELPGWPQLAQPDGAHPAAVESSPTVADLDGNGKMTVIVGAGSSWIANQSGGVVAFNADGSLRWRMQTGDIMASPSMRPVPDGYSEGVFSTPAVGDVDGDGHPDIVFGAWDNKIYALNRDGAALAGFPFWQDDSVWSSPALYDIDGDGRMEIFVGGDSTLGGSVPWNGGVFWALDYSNGGIHELWAHKQVDEVVDGSPAVADLGDGRLAAVVNTGSFYNNVASRQVFAWHLDDGSPVPGWPVTTGGVNSGGVATGDVNGDGHTDVVVTSRDGNVYAYRGDGSLLWKVAPQAAGEGGGEVSGAPIIADVNGDGKQDVVVGNGWATFTLNGHDGARLFSPLDEGWSFQNAPAVGNFGAAGWRLVVTGMHPNGGGVVSSFSIAKPGTTNEWPQWRKNAPHVGAPVSGGNPIAPNLCARPTNPDAHPSDASGRGYWELGIDGSVYAFGVPDYGSPAALGIHSWMVNVAPTGTGNGYWVLGRDGGVFSFGDAAFQGSMGGKPLNAPIISMAPTPSGKGYWLLAADGGVFSFGDAAFWGSTGAMHLNAPIISMAPTKTGKGYWLLALDGGIFSFGDAAFAGSTGAMKLNSPVISMAAAPSGTGYWLLAADGGVFSFGVPFYGSVPGTGVCSPPRGTQIRPTKTGQGYWLLAGDGGVFSFGDAKYFGAKGGLSFAAMAVDLAVRK